MRRPYVHLLLASCVLQGCALVAALGNGKVLQGEEGDAGSDAPLLPDLDADIDHATPVDASADHPDSGRLLHVSSVAVGKTHSCAVIQDSQGSSENGTIRCWGSNGAGELGVDPAATLRSSTPVRVHGSGAASFFADAEDVAVGADYSCAITSGRFFFCWGQVPDESMGGFRRENPVPAFAPSQIDWRQTAVIQASAQSLGDNGGCVVTNHVLACWGAIRVLNGTMDGGAVSIDSFDLPAVGRAHVCAVWFADVRCWGANEHGQAGALPSPWPTSLPASVDVSGKGELRELAAGGDHTCALFGDGAVYCWGRNDRGQLGTTQITGDTNVPQRVELSGAAEHIALGDDHACASMSDKTVLCWGDNALGQLGRGPGAPAFSATPLVVLRVLPGDTTATAVPNVTAIAAGGNTTCALRPYDWPYCWGANDVGQAGQPASPVVAYATQMTF